MKYRLLLGSNNSIVFSDENGNISNPIDILCNGIIEKSEIITKAYSKFSDNGHVFFHNVDFHFIPYGV